jgi:hypothetical protein
MMHDRPRRSVVAPSCHSTAWNPLEPTMSPAAFMA